MDAVGMASVVGATARPVGGEAEISTGSAEDKFYSRFLIRSYLFWCKEDAGVGDAVIAAGVVAMNVNTVHVG